MNDMPSAPDEKPVAFEGRQAFAAIRLQLLVATRHKFALHVPTLPADIFSSQEELIELRRIATSGRGAEIRILLSDPGAALRAGHRLIDLAQRLPSALQIRTPREAEESGTGNPSIWLFNDAYGYLFLPDAQQLEGRSAMHDGPGQAPLVLQFEQRWERATPATQLQPLGL